MSLPTRIPLQSVPIGQTGGDGNLYVEFDWYLFLYNLSMQIFGTGNGGSPASPSDLLDFVDLNADSSDFPQAYRQIANVRALESLNSEIVGTDLAGLQRQMANAQLLLPDADVGPSLRDLVNALLLSTDSLLQDPIQPQGWIAPVLLNSWANFGGGTNPAGYWKDPFGVVHLRGLVKSGTINTAIFTLPIGYRPPNIEIIGVLSNGAIAELHVDNAGNVTAVTGSNTFVCLDSITFRTF